LTPPIAKALWYRFTLHELVGCLERPWELRGIPAGGYGGIPYHKLRGTGRWVDQLSLRLL
jgi:hypothetical protein